jgi:hypothetical protein
VAWAAPQPEAATIGDCQNLIPLFVNESAREDRAYFYAVI